MASCTPAVAGGRHGGPGGRIPLRMRDPSGGLLVNLEVAFLPVLAADLASRVCVVIDVLRATSTLVSMLDAGARRVVLAESVSSALSLAETSVVRPLVCGESGGLPPAGFDMGNSPREFKPGLVSGRELCFCTSNGTRAMRRVSESPAVLAGSLLNASAVAGESLDLSTRLGIDITLVCSGDYLGSRFAIDDAFTAGYLVALLRKLGVQRGLTLDESAVAAERLYRSYLQESGGSDPDGRPPRDAILQAFWESHNARVLKDVGLAEDVEYCSQLDLSSRVPRLKLEDGLLVLS